MGLSVGRAAREGVLWIGWALALILLWALASYDPADPGLRLDGRGTRHQQCGGPGGGLDVELPVRAVRSCGLPVPGAARRRRLGGPEEPRGLRLPAGGCSACGSAASSVMLATSCGLATLHFAANGLPETAGGIVGQLAGLGLASFLSFLGATLLLLALWLAGVSLFTGMSWLAVMDRVGRMTLAAVAAGQQAIEAVRDRVAGRKAAQARQESVERKKQSVVRKTPPRIEPVLAPVEKSERVEKERQARCSRPRRPARFRRWACWTMRRPRWAATPRMRSRPCRAWSS
jgi:DNA segregation ATPase FtsK/SpoIIIE, S-DNA-T family